jgi:hypothetical protein
MDKSSRDYAIDDYEAVEQPDGSYVDMEGVITWYNELGYYHRKDGPALTYLTGRVYWFINGRRYSFDGWCIQLNKTDEDAMMLRLQYG